MMEFCPQAQFDIELYGVTIKNMDYRCESAEIIVFFPNPSIQPPYQFHKYPKFF